MKKLFTIMLSIVLLSSFTLAQGMMKIHQDYDVQIDTTIELSQAEIDGLLLMREEEKLARDVYNVLYEEHKLPIFNNIASSEQTHTDAVKKVLDAYGIEDPIINDEVGVFQNEELAGLYDSLVEQGKTSLLDGLTVGATIEDLDINDLNDLLEETENGALVLTYSNLNKGSRNHIRSFVSQIEKNGGTYEAQYISEEELESILTGETETGAILTEESDIDLQLLQQRLGSQGSRGPQAGSQGNGITVSSGNNAGGVSGAVQTLQQSNNFQNRELGTQVSEYARNFQNNYNNALTYENKISERSGFSRFFMGGDRALAESLREQIRNNEQIIQQLTDSANIASEIDADLVMAQVREMQQENERLSQLADDEANKKGLFRWW